MLRGIFPLRSQATSVVTCPCIDPIPSGTQRPFWSVMIPTYNRREYLRATLESVLARVRTAEDMQIEVVDNCSTDADIEGMVRQLGGTEVSYYRQPRHVSREENINLCIARAQGHWVHVLHDDDIVLPEFYSEFSRVIRKYPSIVMAYCRAIVIDADGQWERIYSPSHAGCRADLQDLRLPLVSYNPIPPSGAIVPRCSYERVGGQTLSLHEANDWELWQRIARLGPVGYCSKPLLLWREYTASGFARGIKSGAVIRERVLGTELAVGRLPPADRQEALRVGRSSAASSALRYRMELHSQQFHRAALEHAIWAFRLTPSLRNGVRVIVSMYRLLRSRNSSIARDRCA